eukprot:11760136-Alexandrium_andersonii.AAC.1
MPALPFPLAFGEGRAAFLGGARSPSGPSAIGGGRRSGGATRGSAPAGPPRLSREPSGSLDE